MGFALGRSFVEVAYGKEGKIKSQAMIKNIESAFQAKLKDLAWMDDATRIEALRKLSKINNKIGYPDHWRNYDSLRVDRKSFLKSLIAAREFGSKYELAKIGKPVDKNEWDMTPPMVNAYYSASMNEIVFPAGILQYPFFNRESPGTSNYGAIGVVMGHELTHGFDDQGRKFNAEGNLTDWWGEKVAQNFEKNATCVADEYSAFEALPGLHVNGRLTLGENIADHGGMALSYSAWRASQIREPSSSQASSGASLTDEQKFFVAFGQSWCQKEQEQLSRMRVTTDPHSPSRYRVNGTVSQFAPFAKAFSCASGTKMAPVNRCTVW
jgi:endothelin-converting enzyme/putative endopeptidase